MALFPGLPRWAGTRKVKPIWILLKQETVSGSGISWAICKSAPCSRQITMPTPHHSVFYRPDALPAAQPTVSKHWRKQMLREAPKKFEHKWKLTQRQKTLSNSVCVVRLLCQTAIQKVLRTFDPLNLDWYQTASDWNILERLGWFHVRNLRLTRLQFYALIFAFSLSTKTLLPAHRMR